MICKIVSTFLRHLRYGQYYEKDELSFKIPYAHIQIATCFKSKKWTLDSLFTSISNQLQNLLSLLGEKGNDNLPPVHEFP